MKEVVGPDGPLLSVNGVSLAFGGVKALTNVSLAVSRGEICAIIGPNGAGKTSLLNIINGFYRPSEGTIWFNGKRRVSAAPYEVARAGIARTFQNLALFKSMSTLDNVLAGRAAAMRRGILWQALRFGPARKEEARHRSRADEIIAFLEIEAIRSVPVARLPYGLQKRVELARAGDGAGAATAEPMAGMNLKEKEDMCRYIVEVNTRAGVTIVLIEHDVGVVMGLADHVVVLDHGIKIADGAPHDIGADKAVIDAYLGVAHEAAPVPGGVA